jgi:hypothetical protein
VALVPARANAIRQHAAEFTVTSIGLEKHED